MKKTISVLFVVVLLASTLIGILAVIPEHVGAQEPAAPQNLQATVGTDGFVYLEWNPGQLPPGVWYLPVQYYNVYRSSIIGDMITPPSIIGTTQNPVYTDKGVNPGETYSYLVTAVSIEYKGITYEGPTSNSVSVTITVTPKVPSKPQSLQANAIDDYVTLSWSAPSSDGDSAITEYIIYRGERSGAEGFHDSVSAPATSYKDTTVTSDKTYWYQVSAKNSVGEGEKSDEKAVRTPSEEPEETPSPSPVVKTPLAPQNLQAAPGDGSVNLSWSAPSDPGSSAITEYNIYRGERSGSGIYLAFVTAPTTTYSDTTVTNDQTYYYMVSAKNAVGEGTKSDEITATPRRGLTMPSAPQNLQTAPGDGYISLSWEAPSDDGGSAITEYKIYRGTSPGEEAPLAFVSAPATAYNDTAVTSDQTYYYKVSAVNSAGEGAEFGEISATPEAVEEKRKIPSFAVIAVIVVALAAIFIVLFKKMGKKKEEEGMAEKEKEKKKVSGFDTLRNLSAQLCPKCGWWLAPLIIALILLAIVVIVLVVLELIAWWWLLVLLVIAAIVILYILLMRREKVEKKEEEKKRFCMHCGTSIPRNVEYCQTCGKEIPTGGGEVKVCKNCGSAIPVVAQFCSECGAAQPKQEGRERFCMHCGALLPLDVKICPQCEQAIPSGGGDVKVCKNCGAAIPVVAQFCSECGTSQPEE